LAATSEKWGEFTTAIKAASASAERPFLLKFFAVAWADRQLAAVACGVAPLVPQATPSIAYLPEVIVGAGVVAFTFLKQPG
jgi:hypothetical protein